MKFQLKGVANLWKEVHTDGYGATQLLDQEFDAPNTKIAVKIAKTIIAGIISDYKKRGGETMFGEFRSLSVELRIVKSFWQSQVAPKTRQVKKSVPVVVIHFVEKMLY